MLQAAVLITGRYFGICQRPAHAAGDKGRVMIPLCILSPLRFSLIPNGNVMPSQAKKKKKKKKKKKVEWVGWGGVGGGGRNMTLLELDRQFR